MYLYVRPLSLNLTWSELWGGVPKEASAGSNYATELDKNNVSILQRSRQTGIEMAYTLETF